jgi:hypothetical protein
MTKPTIKTRNWKAWQNLQPPIGPTVRMTVTGEFESTNSNQTARLTEHRPQGINPAILLLDLTVSTSGVGNDVVQWRDVGTFKKDIRKNQYTEVEILWEGQPVGKAKVESVH